MSDEQPPAGTHWDESQRWLEARAARIFIRAQVDGRWQSVALAELAGELRAFHMGRLCERIAFGVGVVVLKDPA